MTAQLQLARELNAGGLRTRFVPTGQTGIMIEGWGIAVDAVVSDFVAGAAERLVLQGAEDADVVLVEGQGSINHPGYSAVTLGLLHGSCPDALILCHQSSREYIGDYREAAWLRIPPLSEYIRLYESIGSAVHPTRVIGISLNTYDLSDEAARRACEAATRETGLPATDPVRFDASPLLEAVRKGRQAYLASAARAWHPPPDPGAAAKRRSQDAQPGDAIGNLGSIVAPCSLGPPLPLSPDLPLAELLAHAATAGRWAWLRGCRAPAPCLRRGAAGTPASGQSRSWFPAGSLQSRCAPQDRTTGRAPGRGGD